MFENEEQNQKTTVTPPKKGVSRLTFIISLFLIALVGFAAGTRIDDTGYFSKTTKPSSLDLSSVQKTYDRLRAEYDGKIDRSKLIEGANRGLVDAVGDPYSAYFNKEEAEAFAKDLDGTFEGIGAEIGKKDDRLIIIAPLDDSPAKKAGVKSDDIIARVNDKDTQGWSIDKAVSNIKGHKGTTVKLTIVRGDEVKEISITRDTITNPSVKIEQRGKIGLIRISRFGKDTAMLVSEASQQFKDAGVKGVVLDLRGNGGGYLEAAQDVASLWVDEGKTIVTERRGSVITETHQARGSSSPFSTTPTVVLIDGSSASASEIVAGALKDYDKATLIGMKTYGKGSVQNVFDLPGDTKLKVTVAKWYTPDGSNISKEGISPDTKVEIGKNDTRENDTQLKRALKSLQ